MGLFDVLCVCVSASEPSLFTFARNRGGAVKGFFFFFGGNYINFTLFFNIWELFWVAANPSLIAQLGKNLPAMQETWVNSWIRKIPWRRKWQPTPVFLEYWKNLMDRGAWQAIVHGVARVRLDLGTKPPPNPSKTPLISPFSKSALKTIPFISATARSRCAFWQSALYTHLPAHPHRNC